MKLSRDKLKQIIAEELEQEGFLNTIKAKVAPGMLAKSLADEYRVVLDKKGHLDLDLSQIRGDGILGTLKKAQAEVRNLYADDKFRKLPKSYKQKMELYFDTLVKNMSGIQDALEYEGPSGVMSLMKREGIPQDSGLMKMASGVVSAQKSRDDAEADYQRSKEDRARRDRNDYYDRKNARLDSELAAQKAKEKSFFSRSSSDDEYETRAAKPSDIGKIQTVYSGRETGNVRDAWEESKKLTRDRLQQIVREQLEEMMDESRWDPRGGDDERGPDREDRIFNKRIDLMDQKDALESQLKKAEGEEAKEKIKKKIEAVRSKIRALDND